MPFYRDRIYPHLVSKLGDPPPIREIRQRVIPLAQGKVLEIGVQLSYGRIFCYVYRMSYCDGLTLTSDKKPRRGNLWATWRV